MKIGNGRLYGRMTTMISLKNLILKDQSGNVIDLTVDIAPGECVAFVGSPGSGKTALMRILMGETKPTQGSILVDGIPLEKLSPRLLQLYRKNLGVMIQKEQLLPDRSIAENIALPLKAHGAGKKETATRVMELLTKIRLEEKFAIPPAALSENERRRVSLAQAISSDPKILLLDEPFGESCDAESRGMMLGMLRQAKENGATIVITTRNAKDFSPLAPRIERMEREATIQESSQTSWKNTERTRIMPIRL